MANGLGALHNGFLAERARPPEPLHSIEDCPVGRAVVPGTELFSCDPLAIQTPIGNPFPSPLAVSSTSGDTPSCSTHRPSHSGRYRFALRRR